MPKTLWKCAICDEPVTKVDIIPVPGDKRILFCTNCKKDFELWRRSLTNHLEDKGYTSEQKTTKSNNPKRFSRFWIVGITIKSLLWKNERKGHK